MYCRAIREVDTPARIGKICRQKFTRGFGVRLEFIRILGSGVPGLNSLKGIPPNPGAKGQRPNPG